ncbi:MAG: AIR synthase [Firmicutes bacterium]|jgi:hydrogenase expression/formation protein HypE|nr:AIR synthase [Bacillota bacterium]
MRVGKLPPELLQELVLSKLSVERGDVLVHAGLGEDCAIIDFGEEVCIISSDPITGAVSGIGELAVNVACNDIAACGGSPVGIQVVLLLPEEVSEEQIGEIMADIQRTAAKLNVEVIGGHTEVTSRVRDCVAAVTAIGRAPKDRFVTSSGARAGDDLVLTKGVGIEATLILAQDFPDLLQGYEVTPESLQWFRERLSVVPEGVFGAEFGVHAMHDVTEGGLLGAAAELSSASGLGCVIWESAVHIPPLTKAYVDVLGIDPLKLLSSGAMLMATDRGAELVEQLRQRGIPAYIVGRMTEGSQRQVIRSCGAAEEFPLFVQDELWRVLAEE